MISKTILLISFTGRKSGKTYTTPVSYSQSGDQVSIFTHATWWKNLRSAAGRGGVLASEALATAERGGTPVTLRIQGREFQGLAEPVAEDKQAIAAGLTAHLRKVPSDARFYGVTFDDHGNPKADEVEKAVQTVVMIRVQLC
jgi:hypothetical protein